MDKYVLKICISFIKYYQKKHIENIDRYILKNLYILNDVL